jgi:hypothetical protein
LAYNLLHMLRQFYLMGEEVKRSIERLIKLLIKVGAKVAYHFGGGMLMWLQPSLWRDITDLRSGDEGGEKTVDGVTEGEIRSE